MNTGLQARAAAGSAARIVH